MPVPEIRHQMDVYFPAFPSLNAEQLAARVNSLDPDEEDQFHLEKGNAAELGAPPGLPADAPMEVFQFRLGEYAGILLVHGCPSPAAGVITASPLRPDAQQALAAHRAFAFVTVQGGDTYPPFEAELLLRKIGIALSEQGALGVGFPETGLVFPAGLLRDLGGSGADEGGSAWEAIREEGEPMMFLASIVPYESRDGKRWLVTRGFAQCGFPDLVYRVAPGEDLSPVAEMYEGAFSYLIQNGPVFAAGHTMGDPETVAFRFDSVPADLDLPYPKSMPPLLVEKSSGAPKQRKKFLGLF